MSERVSVGGAAAGGRGLPSGTVTLFFSDIEGSTRLLRELRGEYAGVLADHARILRQAFAAHGGRELDTQGDAFFAAFARARDAVAAAADAQRALCAQAWPQGRMVRVRMGLHTGEPDLREAGYVGLDVHRGARICSAAHGGQVLLSRLTAGLVEDDLPAGVSLRELGGVRLKDFDRSERLSQLVVDGLPSEFPPLRAEVVAGIPFAGAEEALASEVAVRSGATATDRVEVRVLGPVAVGRQGSDVVIGAAKQRMILAALALREGEVVSTDRLIDVLWGERPPATAPKALQVYVSELRRLVELDPGVPRVVVTQPPGYRLGLASGGVDLRRFERLWEAGREALAAGAADAAAERLHEALSLWRGEPLADFTYEAGFEADIGRLEEMRLACIEDRIDADLALGRHARLVSDLDPLCRAHPLRERLRAQLMLALYRCGRQADALSVYQQARDALVEQLGIDPSPALTQLERRILQQDPELDPPMPLAAPPPSKSEPMRTLLAVSESSRDVDALVDFARLVTPPGSGRDLVLARMVATRPGHDTSERLREATQRLAEHRDGLAAEGIDARVAAFSSPDPSRDLLKLAHHQDADLIVFDGGRALVEGRSSLADDFLAEAPADVALNLARDQPAPGSALLVPFSGSEHDWAALELAAHIARYASAPLILAGVEATDDETQDASRLLATASLVIQRAGGVTPEPVLVPPGPDGILAQASRARLVVVGLSPRFRVVGLGETRYQIARHAPAPVVFVRRGTRPGVLSPPSTLTRFAWSLSTHRA